MELFLSHALYIFCIYDYLLLFFGFLILQQKCLILALFFPLKNIVEQKNIFFKFILKKCVTYVILISSYKVCHILLD